VEGVVEGVEEGEAVGEEVGSPGTPPWGLDFEGIAGLLQILMALCDIVLAPKAAEPFHWRVEQGRSQC
jgi:hypothetical protein